MLYRDPVYADVCHAPCQSSVPARVVAHGAMFINTEWRLYLFACINAIWWNCTTLKWTLNTKRQEKGCELWPLWLSILSAEVRAQRSAVFNGRNLRQICDNGSNRGFMRAHKTIGNSHSVIIGFITGRRLFTSFRFYLSMNILYPAPLLLYVIRSYSFFVFVLTDCMFSWKITFTHNIIRAKYLIIHYSVIHFM